MGKVENILKQGMVLLIGGCIGIPIGYYFYTNFINAVDTPLSSSIKSYILYMIFVTIIRVIIEILKK